MESVKTIKRLTDCRTNEERIALWRNMGRKVERKVIDLVSCIKIVGEGANAEWVKPDVLPPSNEYLIVGDIQRTYTEKNDFKTQFIESVLMGLPIGTINIKKTREELNEYGDIINVFEVMDGQHRLRALYEFIKGDFKLSPAHLKFLEYDRPISYSSKRPRECLEPVLRGKLRDTLVMVLEVSEGDSVSKEQLDEFGVYSFLNINKTVDNMSEYVKMKAEFTSKHMAKLDDLLGQYTEPFSQYLAHRRLDDLKGQILILNLFFMRGINFKGASKEIYKEIMTKLQNMGEAEFERFLPEFNERLDTMLYVLSKCEEYTNVKHPFSYAILGRTDNSGHTSRLGIASRFSLLLWGTLVFRQNKKLSDELIKDFYADFIAILNHARYGTDENPKIITESKKNPQEEFVKTYVINRTHLSSK